MAYRHGRHSIREAYEQQFAGMDSREVTVHRVVNIVDKRSQMPRPGFEFERGYDGDQWYGGRRNYQDDREYQGDCGYPPNDRRYYDDDGNFDNFRRKSPPPRNEGPYPQQSYGRDDLRHQLASRNNGRARPYFGKKGRGSGPPHREDHGDYRNSPPVGGKRDRSPSRREATQPPVRSGSNSRSRSFSPDRDKSYTHRHKLSAGTSSHPPSSHPSSSHPPSSHPPSSHPSSSHPSSSHPPSSHPPSSHPTSSTNAPSSTSTSKSSEEETLPISGSSKVKAELNEKPSASAAETEEEVVAASVEPKPTPDEDFKARRMQAIKTKALEIEKHYRQDCETFRTVVKMLVDKEPSLDNMLQAPLDKNLLEIKQRCLDSLKQFVKELDEVLEQPSSEATGHKTLK
ncbi:periphilin-1 [Labrus bergylta]|uniref:periphilin-1 n=1 Tax=Labrus bergylta TaxID=56723 RepID=UPI0033144873